MGEIWRLSWSIATSGWRSSYNRSFRFSRMKTAAVALVLQALFFLFIARRAPILPAGAEGGGMGGLLALMAVQMGWFGMMYGFSRGQAQLYQGILVPLFQITPARPIAFLLGRVIEAVPQRAWSTALWAWVYSGVAPGVNRIGTAAILAAYGLAIGMIAHLSGLLLLALWSRVSPKTMRNGNVLFGVLTLALGTWAVIYLSEGGTVTDLAMIMRQYRPIVSGAVVLLGGIPGLLLMLALLVRPVAVEDLYRQGVYSVIELGEQDVSRNLRSIWLPIPDTVLRAVLSREWLQLARAKMTRIQLMIWLAGTVGVYFAGRAVGSASLERTVQFVGALSLFAWFMAYGHWVVRVFEQEKVTIALYRLAAVPTARLMVAKFISLFVPSVALVVLSTAAGCLGAGSSFGQWLHVAGWTALALAAGIVGGFGMAAATADEEPEDPEVTAGPRREMAPSPTGQSNAWWSIARTLALVVTTAIPIWAAAGQPGLAAFKLPFGVLLSVSLLLPLGMLVVGSWIMIRMWESHG